ncbi:thyroid receptor-interacting protein 6 [Cricetulus griseus]|uniref:Arsenite-resistance protein 2 n=1 Tax=Cricetulus griseus TaxID=10029 RepID=A0A061I270_CRIGR|nr:thyroid receptor-interacting protein 6 [Cricetulus griseus]
MLADLDGGRSHAPRRADRQAFEVPPPHAYRAGSLKPSGGRCGGCGEDVVGDGAGVVALDRVFHVGCFVCSTCRAQLRGQHFYAVERRAYCESCYVATLEKCSTCSEPILDRILRAMGKAYHPGCFTCVVCHRGLDGIPFTVDATSQIHCIEDFHREWDRGRERRSRGEYRDYDRNRRERFSPPRHELSPPQKRMRRDWFRSKYHPDEVGKRRQEARGALQNRLRVFLSLMESGWFDNLLLDIDKADAIVKMLDAAVIKMEGGTENDLRILEQEEEEEQAGKTGEASKKEEGRAGPGPGDAERKVNDKDEKKEDSKQAENDSSNDDKTKKSEGDGDKEENKEEAEKEAKKSKKRNRKHSGDDSFDEGSVSESESESESGQAEEEKEETEEALKEKEKPKEEEREKPKDAAGAGLECKPRPLHKTCSLFMRNIAPNISRAEIISPLSSVLPFPPASSSLSACSLIHTVLEWQKTFEEKLTPLLSVRESLSEEEAQKMGRKDPEQEVEKFVTSNTQELGKDKWLCPLSGKKFKGPEFVRKHIFNKHAEKIEEVKKEVAFFNNFLTDAKRPALPEMKPAQPPGPAQSLTPGLPYPHQTPQGLMPYGQPRPPILGYGVPTGGPPYPHGPYGAGRGNYDAFRGQGGYPGKPRNRMVRGDPRAIVEYRDLDAPDDVDFF